MTRDKHWKRKQNPSSVHTSKEITASLIFTITVTKKDVIKQLKIFSINFYNSLHLTKHNNHIKMSASTKQ